MALEPSCLDDWNPLDRGLRARLAPRQSSSNQPLRYTSTTFKISRSRFEWSPSRPVQGFARPSRAARPRGLGIGLWAGNRRQHYRRLHGLGKEGRATASGVLAPRRAPPAPPALKAPRPRLAARPRLCALSTALLYGTATTLASGPARAALGSDAVQAPSRAILSLAPGLPARPQPARLPRRCPSSLPLRSGPRPGRRLEGPLPSLRRPRLENFGLD
jgi:hypothetical protein